MPKLHVTLTISLLIFGVLSLVAAGLAAAFLPYLSRTEVASELAGIAPIPSKPLAHEVQYFPPAPADAPAVIHDQVLLGRDLIAATRARLPASVGNTLSCESCHFSAGLGPAGRNGGFSLVGVAAHFPANGFDADLAAKIADCFRRNLHGHAPASGSPDLSAMVAYLRWISSGVPYLAQVPWLEPRPLTPERQSDAAAGERLEAETCAPCHGDHGQGTHIAPATHGPGSFTTAAQILAPGILERFLYENMPRSNPTLTVAQAADAAAYLRAQPRPRPAP